MNKLEKFLNSKFLVTLFSILLGFVVGALFLLPMGISPIEAYAKLFDGVFGSVRNMAYSVVSVSYTHLRPWRQSAPRSWPL